MGPGRVLCALWMLLAAAGGRAELLSLELGPPEPFADGARFGDAGAYERLTGVARGELDPEDPQNAVIVDLERAPRNARGRVEYEIDVFVLRPVAGSRKLLYDVTNRGSKVALSIFDAAQGGYGSGRNDPRSLADAGNGFLLGRGYTLVWSGWDPTVRPEKGHMTVRFPVARNGRDPIVERVRDEFSFGIFPATIPAFARLSQSALRPEEARLTVRGRERDAPVPLPPTAWTWLDPGRIALLAGPFEPGALYDLSYIAADPPVLGIGFAAVRDLVSHLRYEAPSEGDPAIEYALAVGVSQSGRFLRHFVELGMNRDEGDRRVFDGVLPYVSGSGKVFANHRFGQPGRTAGQHTARLFPEHWFPFAHAPLADPHGAGVEGLLRGDGSDPLILEANTSTEYWHKGASLLHTDALAEEDVELPDGVRLYLISGTEHAGGMLIRDAACANPGNPHRPNAALRALLVALEEWVRDGTPPPDSRIPRIHDGTLVPLAEFAFPPLPGVAVADVVNRIRVPGSWVEPRPEDGAVYGVRVPQVGPDGNELAGLRLPPIAAPLATYTGWNVFREPYPAGDLCGRSGSYVPLAATPGERRASGDPRASVLERFPTREAYVEAVRSASAQLVEARLLLPEDAAAYEAEAREVTGPWATADR